MLKSKIHETMSILDEVKEAVNSVRRENGEEDISIDTEYVFAHLDIVGADAKALGDMYFLKEEMEEFAEDYLAILMTEEGVCPWMKEYVQQWADTLVKCAVSLRQNPLWVRAQVTHNLLKLKEQNINVKFLLKDFANAYHIAVEKYRYRFPTEWDK